MSSRSLTTSDTGSKLARQTLERKGLSQRSLMGELGFAWSTINKFFNCKPVDRFHFIEICQRLELDWE
ncbi:hypothetical protein IQ266_25190, partial [filamentous cyanobacterium LEGE 11480]|nr:hypothetical protein [Romeriopsis navalis LEGE 11480]